MNFCCVLLTEEFLVNICLQAVSCQTFELNNFINLRIGVRETLIFALNKFFLKARHVSQIKITVSYGIFFILKFIDTSIFFIISFN